MWLYCFYYRRVSDGIVSIIEEWEEWQGNVTTESRVQVGNKTCTGCKELSARWWQSETVCDLTEEKIPGGSDGSGRTGVESSIKYCLKTV